MPSSATRTFTDPDMYFAGIRNLQIDGVITKRGEIPRGVDAHRPAPPVDASHRREPASDHEDNVEREAVADPLRDQSLSASDAGQRDRNIASSNRNVRVGLAVLPSILCGLRMGYHVADARGPRRGWRGHHRASTDATLISSMDQPPCTCRVPPVAAARSGGPSCEDRFWSGPGAAAVRGRGRISLAPPYRPAGCRARNRPALAPIEHGRFGAVPLGHLAGVGLDLSLAPLAPNFSRTRAAVLPSVIGGWVLICPAGA